MGTTKKWLVRNFWCNYNGFPYLFFIEATSRKEAGSYAKKMNKIYREEPAYCIPDGYSAEVAKILGYPEIPLDKF